MWCHPVGNLRHTETSKLWERSRSKTLYYGYHLWQCWFRKKNGRNQFWDIVDRTIIDFLLCGTLYSLVNVLFLRFRTSACSQPLTMKNDTRRKSDYPDISRPDQVLKNNNERKELYFTCSDGWTDYSVASYTEKHSTSADNSSEWLAGRLLSVIQRHVLRPFHFFYHSSNRSFLFICELNSTISTTIWISSTWEVVSSPKRNRSTPWHRLVVLREKKMRNSSYFTSCKAPYTPLRLLYYQRTMQIYWFSCWWCARYVLCLSGTKLTLSYDIMNTETIEDVVHKYRGVKRHKVKRNLKSESEIHKRSPNFGIFWFFDLSQWRAKFR